MLKAVAVKRPGLHMYGRKDGKDGYVNMAVLDESKRQMKWFTCYGVAFDSIQLGLNEYNQLTSRTLDPFLFTVIIVTRESSI